MMQSTPRTKSCASNDAEPRRYLSCAMNLDYDSMAGGDKFGNVFVTRMPADISLQVEDDPTGGKFAANGGMLNSAPHKVQPVINFHVGDLLMSLQLTAMQSGGREVRTCMHSQPRRRTSEPASWSETLGTRCGLTTHLFRTSSAIQREERSRACR